MSSTFKKDGRVSFEFAKKKSPDFCGVVQGVQKVGMTRVFNHSTYMGG